MDRSTARIRLSFSILKYLPQGKRKDPEHCPLALAIKDNLVDPLKIVQKVEVLGNELRITFTDNSVETNPLIDEVAEVIRHYDETGEWPTTLAFVNTFVREKNVADRQGQYRRAA